MDAPAAGGAYGLRLDGVPAAALVPDPPADWPRWRVEQRRVAVPDAPDDVTVEDGHAVIGMPPTGRVLVARAEQRIVVEADPPVSPDALVHPVLAAPCAVIAWWMGRGVLHASAVVAGGGAWLLLAAREGGKSTTAALLAGLGADLLSDDLAVLAGGDVLAGPATVDLRAEPARRLGGRALGRVGARDRWRLARPVARASAPLRGCVLLGWDATERIEPVAPADRLGPLADHAVLPPTPQALLDLAGVPMLRFDRPPDLARAEDGARRLLSTMARSRP